MAKQFFSKTFAILFALACASLVGAVVAGDRGPLIPKAKGEQCVAETGFMRRNHMDLILHQRDETVVKGIRDEPFSLVECVDCHVQHDANNTPIRVDAEGQFCASCHAFVAAKIDCFSCHAAVPDTNREARVDGPSPRHLSAQATVTFTPPNAAKGQDHDEARKSRYHH